MGYDLVTEMTRTRAVEPAPPEPAQRAAVIYNPTKVTDWVTFRRHVEYELRTRGWDRRALAGDQHRRPGTGDDRAGRTRGRGPGPGRGRRRHDPGDLLRAGRQRGPVRPDPGRDRATCWPSNIGIPLDEAAALDVAFDGLDKAVDLVTPERRRRAGRTTSR